LFSLWAAAMAATGFLYFAQVNHDLLYSFGGDETTYIVLALALSQGQGFTNVSKNPPVPQIHFPFFHPLLLSLVIRLFGLNIPLMKIMVISIYLAGLLLFVDLMRLKKEAFVAGLAVLLAASEAFPISYSRSLMSELPYVGLSLAALWAFGRAEESKRASAWLLLSAGLGLAAYYTRSAGVSLLAALAVAMIITARKSGEKINLWPRFAAALIMAGGVLAWIAYCYKVGGAESFEYFFEFLRAEHGKPDQSLGAVGILTRSAGNAFAYLKILGRLIAPWIRNDSLTAGIVAALLAVLGYARLWQKKFLAVQLYAAFYLLVILGWDFADQRLLLPLYALIYFFIVSGAVFAGNLVRKGFGLRLAAVLTAAVFALNFYYALPSVKKRGPVPGMDIGRHFRFVPTSSAHWDMMKLEVWAGENLPRQSKFLVNFSEDFFLMTGRPCVYPLPAAGAASLDILTRYKVDYIFLGDAYPVYSDWFMTAILSAPGLFEKVREIPRSHSAIYRFHWQRAQK